MINLFVVEAALVILFLWVTQKGHKFLPQSVQLTTVMVIPPLFFAIGKIGIGTFLIDPFMLIFFGYLSTRWLFSANGPITKLRPKKIWRLFIPSLFFSNLLVLIGLGVFAYYDVVSASGAYLGLVPEWLIGIQNGNAFMWDGFIIHLFGVRIMPVELIPTYNSCILFSTPKLWFVPSISVSLLSIWGILIWASLPIFQWWGVWRGQAHAYLPLKGLTKLRATLEMFGIAVAAQLVIIALTLFIVRVGCY